jgi:hypothetical protein
MQSTAAANTIQAEAIVIARDLYRKYVKKANNAIPSVWPSFTNRYFTAKNIPSGFRRYVQPRFALFRQGWRWAISPMRPAGNEALKYQRIDLRLRRKRKFAQEKYRHKN